MAGYLVLVVMFCFTFTQYICKNLKISFNLFSRSARSSQKVDLFAEGSLGKCVAKAQAREFAKRAWRERWLADARDRWAASLIGDPAAWADRRHGEVDYYLIQFLTGHGYFCSYLGKMASIIVPEQADIEQPLLTGVQLQTPKSMDGLFILTAQPTTPPGGFPKTASPVFCIVYIIHFPLFTKAL
uniref:Uncharacterized protein n=1 Tax=Rhodnius prolixus TaxID=13249 RepID=T1HSP2_RHOPR